MLVLARLVDESIEIEGGIVVKVVSVQGGRVHLGITAPKQIGIWRQELAEMIRRENREAAKVK